MEEIRDKNKVAREEAAAEVLKSITAIARRIQEVEGSSDLSARAVERNEAAARAIERLSHAYYNILNADGMLRLGELSEKLTQHIRESEEKTQNNTGLFGIGMN